MKNIDPIAQCILNYKNEAEVARRKRMERNRENFEIYNLNQDYSHKKVGQSQEFLAKQQMAVEQITSFVQQGVIDLKNWFKVEFEPGVDKSQIRIDESTLEKLTLRHIEKNEISNFLGDSVKMGILGSLAICKVHGCHYKKSRWSVDKSLGSTQLIREDRKYWQLKLELIRQEDYYPDPTGSNLYEIQGIDMDYHDLLALAEAYPEDYDLELIKTLSPETDMEQELKKARETDQVENMYENRKRIRLYEMWGTIIDTSNKKVTHKDSVCAITESGLVIRKPSPNPFWHNERPFIVHPFVRIPKSVWHRALMDASTKHNIALNELYNLMVDGGLMSVFGIRQIREDWLDDPSQVDDGIPAGTTLSVTSTCPPGQKVLERVDTGTLGSEAFNMFQMMDREHQSSSLTNDVRMGNLPQRAVKATEIVASNQTITGMFNGVIKLLEENYVTEILRKSALLLGQYMDDLDLPEIEALIGEQKAQLVKMMTPEERFVEIANGCRFKVYGLSSIINKMNDFRKVTSLLQVVGASPQLMNEFMKKYSFTKLMGEIVQSLDIDEQKIVLSEEEKIVIAQEKAMQQQMQMMQIMGKGGATSNPDMMSQVPNMANQDMGGGPMPDQQALQEGVSGGSAY